MPAVATFDEVQRAGGGTLRYLLSVPLALAQGALIVVLEWNLSKALWLRSQKYSKKAQNAIAVAVFALDLLSIVTGGLAGGAIARFLIRYIA